MTHLSWGEQRLEFLHCTSKVIRTVTRNLKRAVIEMTAEVIKTDIKVEAAFLTDELSDTTTLDLKFDLLCTPCSLYILQDSLYISHSLTMFCTVPQPMYVSEVLKQHAIFETPIALFVAVGYRSVNKNVRTISVYSLGNNNSICKTGFIGTSTLFQMLSSLIYM